MPTGSDQARLFFALDPPPRVRQQVVAQRTRLAWRGRAVPDQNLHITLVFIGNVPRARLAELLSMAASMAFPRTHLLLDHAGHFSRSGVGWLGCSELPEDLGVFRQTLVESLASLQLGHDKRRWKPHLTLYRDLRKPSVRIDIEPIEWPLQAFVLMESVNNKNGLIYRSLGRWQAS
jgi:2'-5' RNA ligase